MASPAIAERTAERAGADARLLAQDFDRIVREHQRRVFRVIYGILRDADAADSLSQECFLRAWQQRAGFRGEASVATWLTRIAVNLAIDQQRNRRASFWKRLFALQPGGQSGDAAEADAWMMNVPDGRASPERQLLALERAEQVWQIAGGLPVQQRAVFQLRFAEELALEEIAQAMDLSVGTVKGHLFRAVQTVRAQMKRQGLGSRKNERAFE